MANLHKAQFAKLAAFSCSSRIPMNQPVSSIEVLFPIYKAAIPKFCKTWKQPRWPSVGEWIKAVVLIYPFSGVFITQQWKEMSYSARKRQEGTLNTSC